MDAEDEKLLTLARAALPRSRGPRGGAAVRDEIGRTYAAAAVELGDLRLSALEVALAMAASSGATKLEAAAYISDEEPDDRTTSALLALGDPTLIRG